MLFTVRSTIFTGNVFLPKPDGILFPAFGGRSDSQSEAVAQIGKQMKFGIYSQRLKILHPSAHSRRAGDGIVLTDYHVGRRIVLCIFRMSSISHDDDRASH